MFSDITLLLLVTQGLTEKQAKDLYAANGPNAITPFGQRSEIIKFSRHLVRGFSLLLMAASVLSFLAYGIQIFQADAQEDSVGNVR